MKGFNCASFVVPNDVTLVTVRADALDGLPVDVASKHWQTEEQVSGGDLTIQERDISLPGFGDTYVRGSRRRTRFEAIAEREVYSSGTLGTVTFSADKVSKSGLNVNSVRSERDISIAGCSKARRLDPDGSPLPDHTCGDWT